MFRGLAFVLALMESWLKKIKQKYSHYVPRMPASLDTKTKQDYYKIKFIQIPISFREINTKSKYIVDYKEWDLLCEDLRRFFRGV